MINRPKGTKDVLPSEVYKWQKVEKVAKECLRLRGFEEIRTPTFEHTELFVRGVGEGSDIVNKEMYTFLDKGDRSLTLKPEGTASIVRAVIENGLDNEAMPLKLYMLTPCFRYERPQTGRFREHYQFSIEAFGSPLPIMEFEVIGTLKSILDALGFSNYLININSIGCKSCRGEYVKALKEYYSKYYDELCDDCKVRFNKNPLRLLDCKEEKCQQFKKNAPKPREFLCDDCKTHFENLQELLKAGNIEYVINDNLVRGIDYYSRTVFEFLTKEKGALNVVCGGGRYDGLVEQLGGKPLASVGVGLGIEHLLLLLEKNGIEIKKENGLDLYLAPTSQQELPQVTRLATKLRELGVATDFDTMNRSLKAQMKYADKKGAKFVMIIGGDELENQTATLRCMADKNEVKFEIKTDKNLQKLADYIKGQK